MGLNRNRWECVRLFRRGEFHYAEYELRKILVHMQPELRRNVVDDFNACNYTRVADLLEYQWKGTE